MSEEDAKQVGRNATPWLRVVECRGITDRGRDVEFIVNGDPDTQGDTHGCEEQE